MVIKDGFCAMYGGDSMSVMVPTIILPITLKYRVKCNVVFNTHLKMTEFRQPLQVQSHLEMPGILVQLGHIQRT